ncbi:putative RNA-directed DNA polymerase from mobile element jockey-like [Apostichopus japonicus]|uniref:Putative RNA-directed DNA polymerase from mobile element jockey-like n=1 Tax=Stichopus japonicus TaxID=307972 RepID=A0A2G8KBK7_STIJA|nr:putative RNA-directed DNA polymerase from mobile element jockey-like [Apostichopus japonicus]
MTNAQSLSSRFINIFFFEVLLYVCTFSEGKSKSFSLTVQKPPSCALDMWEPATEDELKRIIMASPSKSCGLDPLPTNLLKECVTPLLPVISTIVNNSLITGDVPSAFKLAHVTPLIKKPSLDPTVLSNYRPVSNLPFVSKILEKVVSSRLTSYLEHNGLQETHQSAYRKHHSTETALVRIQNDVMVALGGQKVCLMVLLDLSAAFDTVDHLQLLTTLSDLGVKSTALKWMTSYLSDRQQIVCLGKDSSALRR